MARTPGPDGYHSRLQDLERGTTNEDVANGHAFRADAAPAAYTPGSRTVQAPAGLRHALAERAGSVTQTMRRAAPGASTRTKICAQVAAPKVALTHCSV
jgi:hypothetical protein